jgi:hypothetical protein
MPVMSGELNAQQKKAVQRAQALARSKKSAQEAERLRKEVEDIKNNPVGAFIGEFGKNAGDLAKTIAQGTVQLPERLYQTLEEMRANSLLSTGKPTTGRYESPTRTGIVGEVYGKEPVQSYFQTGRDMGSAMQQSDNPIIRGASGAAPFIGPALAALDLAGMGMAGFPLTKAIVNKATGVGAKQLAEKVAVNELIKGRIPETSALSKAIEDVKTKPIAKRHSTQTQYQTT